jgi:enoyl-CoA hydratase/carnithine racemase
MDFRTLSLQIESPIARLTLSRPGEANRVDARMLRELTDACEAIAANDTVCVTLLTADGPDFCAGWDADLSPLPREGEGQGEASRRKTTNRLPLDPFGPIAALPSPVIGAVQGATLSAGLELALACDIRIASDDARFGLPEVSQGTLH